MLKFDLECPGVRRPHSKAPMLEFRSVSEIRGLEYVEAIRFGDK